MAHNENITNQGNGSWQSPRAKSKKVIASNARPQAPSIYVTKVSKQGNSLGVRLPKEILEKTGLSHGDSVKMRADENRVTIEKEDSVYNRAMEIGKEVAIRYRHALAKLAK